MSFFTPLVLAWANARLDRRRNAYLSLTLAVSVCLCLLLSALAAPFVAQGIFSGTGISISNGSQANGHLPLRYARRIAAIPGVKNLAWLGALVVGCGSASETVVTLNGYGGPGTEVIIARKSVAPAQLETWKSDPIGILISTRLARECGWRIGQGIEPPNLWTGEGVRLHVNGTFASDGLFAYAHYDYINRLGPIGGTDSVFYYNAMGDDERDNDRLAARIETAFASDFPSVRAVANATVQGSWARFGKLQQLVGLVVIAVWLCAMSVWISALAHSSEQRRTLFATQMVIGFSHNTLRMAQGLEVTMVAILGCMAGVTGSWLLARSDRWKGFDLLADGMRIPTASWWQLGVGLSVLLVLTSIWPQWVIHRTSATDTRRQSP